MACCTDMAQCKSRGVLLCRRNKPEARDRGQDSKSDRTQPSRDTAEQDQLRASDDHTNRRHHGHDSTQSTDRDQRSRPEQRNDNRNADRSDRDAGRRDGSNARDSTTSVHSRESEAQIHSQRNAFARRPVVNPNSKQAELLASVASEMNTFSNDGSFMDQFAAKQAGGIGIRGAEGEQLDTAAAADEAELALSGVHCFFSGMLCS